MANHKNITFLAVEMANHENMSEITTVCDLPMELVEKIITHLPLDVAARAALISKRFVNSWKLSRHLNFDEHKLVNHRLVGSFVEFVDRILDQHSGYKIETFNLKMGATDDEISVRNWIRTAIAKGVEELVLEFWGIPRDFPIPSDLIDTDESLKVFKLRSCYLQFLPRLNGLKLLKTLNLVSVHLTSSLIRIIFNNCLALENLDLFSCNFIDCNLEIKAKELKHFKSLKVTQIYHHIDSMFIDAPTLQSLYYKGDVCIISFGCVLRKLFMVLFNFGPNKRLKRLHNVGNLVTSLHHCKELSVCSKILEELAPKFNGHGYAEIPYSFPTLWELRLCLGGSNLDGRGTTSVNPYDILSFLMKCPRIHTILLDLGENAFEEGLFWKLMVMERFVNCRPLFRFLKNLTVKGFKYRNLEFMLVRKIVENAPFVGTVSLIKLKTKTNLNRTLQREREKLLLAWMKTQRCNFILAEEPLTKGGIHFQEF